MLKNILNLDGVAVLSKEQQKNISGGYGLEPLNPGLLGGVSSYCKLTYTLPSGAGESGGSTFSGNTYKDVSIAAGVECAKVMKEFGASRCTYDCAYDGVG